MSDTKVKPIPEGIHTITPHIVVGDAAEASDWYAKAFGAEERSRIPLPGGKVMTVELWIGDSPVMVAGEFPDMGIVSPLRIGGTATVLHIYTDDVDAAWERAIAAGAEERTPLGDMFWGDRHGQLTDPFGHRWNLAQHIRDVPPEEITAAAAEAFAG
ncbi:MAG: PhnB protein [Solirubrobacterales bacterium]|jgi:PhnB protein|nr:PhnB protein [Solirubrobacterales bacterium]